MKKYIAPKFDIVEIKDNDVITASGGLVNGGAGTTTSGELEWSTLPKPNYNLFGL